MAPRLALLLHMHQPEYRDPDTGRPWMPWVRLHASRGYTDVAQLALEHGARFTLNVVPGLLEQLLACTAGVTDRWEELSRVRAEDLHERERAFLRERFVHGHPAMRAASPRYQELAGRLDSLDAPGDLRDLQVWSNLAWMGSVGRRDPGIRALLAQDRDFSHEQLLYLMDHQRKLVQGVIPLWRQLPEISTSPLCHPILPLLVDFRHARRCLPDLPPDLGAAARFRWPDDARRQLREAQALCARVLGRRPAGLWPSEGALSPEVLDMVEELGFAWAASDAGLLHRSERDRDAALDGPWVRAGHEAGTRLLFRDQELSDRIGFVYQSWSAEDAVADLLSTAEARYGDRAVPIILDGENPWEAFPDAGEAFMRALFGSGALVGLGEAAQAPARGRIRRLHTGSWIGADLRIWAGDAADRAGWSLLAEAREAWEAAGRPEAGWPHLANAESSDWFWWLGPEFETEVADLFDALFRAHLAAVWRSCGLPAPLRLRRPVAAPEREGPLRVSAQIRPPLDGEPHPALWAGATVLPIPREGAMARGDRWFLGGAAALGEGRVWLRFDLDLGRADEAVGLDQLFLELDGHESLWLAAAPSACIVVAGPRLVLVGLPWSEPELRLALRDDAGGRRHPVDGWLVLHLDTGGADQTDGP